VDLPTPGTGVMFVSDSDWLIGYFTSVVIGELPYTIE